MISGRCLKLGKRAKPSSALPAHANVETVAFRRLGGSGKLDLGTGAEVKNASPGQQKSVTVGCRSVGDLIPWGGRGAGTCLDWASWISPRARLGGCVHIGGMDTMSFHGMFEQDLL